MIAALSAARVGRVLTNRPGHAPAPAMFDPGWALFPRPDWPAFLRRLAGPATDSLAIAVEVAGKLGHANEAGPAQAARPRSRWPCMPRRR